MCIRDRPSSAAPSLAGDRTRPVERCSVHPCTCGADHPSTEGAWPSSAHAETNDASTLVEATESLETHIARNSHELRAYRDDASELRSIPHWKAERSTLTHGPCSCLETLERSSSRRPPGRHSKLPYHVAVPESPVVVPDSSESHHTPHTLTRVSGTLMNKAKVAHPASHASHSNSPKVVSERS